MKIYYLSQSFLPSRAANSVHVMRMCAALSKLGYKVKLGAAKKFQFKEIKNNHYEYYGIENNLFDIDVKVFPKLGWFGRALYVINSFISLIKFNPKVVITRHIYAVPLLNLFGYKYFLEMHAPPIGYLEEKILKNSFDSRELIKLILISEALKSIIVEKYNWIDEAKILVCHDGADENKNNFESGVAINGCIGLNVGYSGHLYKGRGIDIIIEVAKKMPNLNFHILGGNDPDINYWKSNSPGKNVIFYGHKPSAFVAKFLISMDVLLAPYQNEVSVSGGGLDTSKWMSPLKLFEYMAAGKPIVCSDISVLREVMQDKENCLLVRCDHVNDWVIAITTLLQDLKLADKLAKQSRVIFLNNYTWTARCITIKNFFPNE